MKIKVHVVGLDVWPLYCRAFVAVSLPLSLLWNSRISYNINFDLNSKLL
jgi:hypothetical protein